MESIDVEEIYRRSKRLRFSSTKKVNSGTATAGHGLWEDAE
jgi:hypothetical protein